MVLDTKKKLQETAQPNMKFLKKVRLLNTLRDKVTVQPKGRSAKGERPDKSTIVGYTPL
jgi:hypothetical protein